LSILRTAGRSLSLIARFRIIMRRLGSTAPFFLTLYRAYPGAGSKTITAPIPEKASGLPYRAEFDESALEIIDEVALQYGGEHGFKLSYWTHAKNSPWDITLREKGLYAQIDDNEIKDYFKKLVANEEGAAI
jgi:uncharacterized phage-associated protein